MSTSARDKRRAFRRRCRLKVFTSRGVWFTVDVGRGGFCAQVLRALPPGTMLEGTFHVDEANLPFAGQVIWAKSGNPHINVKGRMGIAVARGAEELEAFLSARQPPGPRERRQVASARGGTSIAGGPALLPHAE